MDATRPALVEVHVTCPDRATADLIAAELVTGRLAACTNVVDGVHSTYWWDGAVETGDEVLVIAKTRADLFDRLAERVASLHPDEVPAVLGRTLAFVNEAYARWVIDETGPR